MELSGKRVAQGLAILVEFFFSYRCIQPDGKLIRLALSKNGRRFMCWFCLFYNVDFPNPDTVDLIVDFEGNKNIGEVSCCLVFILIPVLLPMVDSYFIPINQSSSITKPSKFSWSCQVDFLSYLSVHYSTRPNGQLISRL